MDGVKGLAFSFCPLPTGSYEAVTADASTGQRANLLFEKIRRLSLGNAFVLPTDGALGDGPLAAGVPALCRTAGYNADVYNFFRRWMCDWRDLAASRTDEEMGSAAVCRVPWQMYWQYGDTQIVEENLEAMMDYLNALAFLPAGSDSPAGYAELLDATAQMAGAVGRSDYARVLQQRIASLEQAAAEAPGTDALPALSQAGRWQEAYDAFCATESSDPDVLGATGLWMYEYQLGISPGPDAGYQNFVLQPVAGGDFLSLKGGFESDYGRIESAWTADGAGRMTSYTAVVPANTSATLYLPVGSDAVRCAERPFARFCGIETHNGVLTAVYRLASGTFTFEIRETQVILQ